MKRKQCTPRIQEGHVKRNYGVVDRAVKQTWDDITRIMMDVVYPSNRNDIYFSLLLHMRHQQSHIMQHLQPEHLLDLSDPKCLNQSVFHVKLKHCLLAIKKVLGMFSDPAFQLAVLDELLHHVDDELWYLAKEVFAQ